MESVRIDPERCIGCGLCAQVCIRGSISVKEHRAVYDRGSCFSCYHCAAICPRHAISISDGSGISCTDVPSGIPVDYDHMMSLLRQRRSIRWFTEERVTVEEFGRMFDAARYSPTSMHRQDVEFVVIDERLEAFMQLVYDALKPFGDAFPRIREFCSFMEGDRKDRGRHPFLWEGKQIILVFSEVPADALIAMTRVELTGYTMGVGGFYSLFLIMAAEKDPEGFSRFFGDIDPKKRMRCAYVVGHPRVKYKRTPPSRRLDVHFM